MAENTNNVLFISYYFPPAGGPGVQRVLKFVKYLPEFGWNPVVLTVKNGDYPAYDESLVSEIPDTVPVYRVPAIEPHTLYRKFTQKKTDEKIPVGLLSKNDASGFKEKFARWVRANIFIPDARVACNLPMIKTGKEIIRKHQIRAIFCSTPPHSLQLSAMYLSKKWNIPWIADFRDPWTDIFYYQNIDRMRISRSLDKLLEKRVLKNSNSVVTVSKSIMEKLYRNSEQKNIQVLHNGYDAFDFEKKSGQECSNSFKISYVGNLKSNQNIPALWNVFSELISADHTINLNFVGNVHPAVISALKDNDIYEITHFRGYVSHEEAIREMQNSSVLLYIIPQAPDNAGILTGKLFEYLAAKRPFLALGPPDGDAADILKGLNMGPMIDYSDKPAMEARLQHLLSLWNRQELHSEIPSENGIRKFERKYQTGKLAQQLKRLTHATI